MPTPAKYKPTKYERTTVRTSLFGGGAQHYTGKQPVESYGGRSCSWSATARSTA